MNNKMNIHMNNKINIIKYIEKFFKDEKYLNIEIENINYTEIINGKIKIDFNYFPVDDGGYIYGDDDYRIGNFNLWDSPKDDDDDDDIVSLVEHEIIYLDIIFNW